MIDGCSRLLQRTKVTLEVCEVCGSMRLTTALAEPTAK